MAATSYIQQDHHSNNRSATMRRTAPLAPRKAALVRDGSDVRHQSAPQPSRLEQIQADFQRNLLLEKERRLVALHKRKQDHIPKMQQQVKGTNSTPTRSEGKRGVVREFFKERRQMEKDKTVDRYPAPSTHLQQLRSEKDALHLQEQIKQEELQHFARKQRGDQLQKVRAGYSKNKLLDPIKQPDRITNHPSLPVGHVAAKEQRASEHLDQEGYGAPHREILSKPRKKAPPHPNSLNLRKQSRNSPKSNEGNKTIVTGTPSRTLPKLNVAKKSPAKKAVLTDFQKWQLEQDQQRDARLKNYEEKLDKEKEGRSFSGTFDEGEISLADTYSKKDKKRSAKDKKKQEYENIRSKERELEAMIAKHQEELAKLQLNDSDDDEGNEISQENVDLYVGEENIRTDQNISLQQSNTKDKAESSFTVNRQRCYDENDNKIGEPANESDWYTRKGQAKSLASFEREQVRQEFHGEVIEGTSFYVQAVNNLPETASFVDLRPCQNCGRNFAAGRLPKHAQICQKVSKTKRKVFDSTSHRTSGTEFSEYVKKGRHLKEPAKKPTSNWKKKHEDFVRAIRDARKVQAHVAKGGKLSDLPPPPPAENLDYQQCPYCKRKFNPSAAERHIPHCKTTKSRPKPPPQQRGNRINFSTSTRKLGGAL